MGNFGFFYYYVWDTILTRNIHSPYSLYYFLFNKPLLLPTNVCKIVGWVADVAFCGLWSCSALFAQACVRIRRVSTEIWSEPLQKLSWIRPWFLNEFRQRTLNKFLPFRRCFSWALWTAKYNSVPKKTTTLVLLGRTWFTVLLASGMSGRHKLTWTKKHLAG